MRFMSGRQIVYINGYRCLRVKVLVCSPFTESVRLQLPFLGELFRGGYIPFEYPKFDPVLIKAHNTVSGNEPFPHQNWRESLEDLTCQMMSHNFDIALLGCGSYGTPLCENLRSEGRSAFYLGSYCQVMFGIKGKRWENAGNPIATYFNEYWRNPSAAETPKSFKEIEGGCYW